MDASNQFFRSPWEGKSRIIIGIEIGTDETGVSFTFLQEGGEQTIYRIVKWPGQQDQQAQSKIPTLVWYDKNKKVVSCGAEALSLQTEEEAESNSWMLAKQFPLHLYPNASRTQIGLQLRPLPKNVSLQQVYSDFFGYLLKHTKMYFEDHILDGRFIWKKLKPTVNIVIPCPDEWGFREQEFLQNALVNAGFFDGAVASEQILFVTNSEAIFNFTGYHTNLTEHLQTATDIVTCDAGASTVKMARFSVVATHPVLKFKKLSSALIQEGGKLVDAALESYLRSVLGNAGLSHEEVSEYTSQGVRDFELSVKRLFRDATADCVIEIAGARFNNPSIRTRRGRMSLPGLTVQSFFNDFVSKITTPLDDLLQLTKASSCIVLSGEFGDSPFLRKTLKERYGPQGHQLYLPNDSMTKAVADGALIWGVIHRSNRRVQRFSYGFIVSIKFEPEADDHQGRDTYVSSEGYENVTGAWSQIVSKGDRIDYDDVVRVPFERAYVSPDADLGFFSGSLFAHSRDEKPNFARDEQGKLLDGFRKICTMTADLANLRGALQEVKTPGKSHWSLAYQLCLHFGGVELSASVEWQEKGVARTDPVKIKPFEAVYLD